MISSINVRFLSSVVLIGLLLLFSCKKTDEDVENEKIFIGEWSYVVKQFGIESEMIYRFEDDNKGSSTKDGSTDEFSWEIKKGSLNTYYKKAPDYPVGQDKYNSKGVYTINSVEQDEISLTQIFYSGNQIPFTMTRIK